MLRGSKTSFMIFIFPMFFCFILLVILICALHMVSSCVLLISMASRCVVPIILMVSSCALHLISMVELCSLIHLNGLDICYFSVFYGFELCSLNHVHGLKMCYSPSFDALELCSPSHFNGLELAYLVVSMILICFLLVDLVILRWSFHLMSMVSNFVFHLVLAIFELWSFGHFNGLDGLKICSFDYF